jgi:Ca-activated chloride channel family protein
VSIELLDGNNKPTETNINVSFINTITRAPAYEFVHYLDKTGRPDTVQIDPVLSYDIIVNTLPPVIRQNVAITNGKHNVISIAAPQGSLIVKSQLRGNPFLVLVKKSGERELLHQQTSNQNYRYLQGEYEIETLTLPRRTFAVSIEADKTKTITIPATGLVNINTTSAGYGSLFEILDTGETKWVCNLDQNKSQHSYNLLPGSYKVSFRVRHAKGSKYTGVKNFQITSGQTATVSLF